MLHPIRPISCPPHSTDEPMHDRARAVLAFWFGTEFEHLGAYGAVPPEKMKIWYGGGPALDQVGQRKLIGIKCTGIPVVVCRGGSVYAPMCAPTVAISHPGLSDLPSDL